MQSIIEAIFMPDGKVLIPFFFKAFAIVFAVLFFVFSVVVVRQTKVMNKTFTTKKASVIAGISFFQLMLAILLFFVAVFLI